MNDQQLVQLEEYRAQALEELMKLSDFLVSDENVAYDSILALARSTNNPELFGKALEKIRSIEDEQERSTALLTYLDEIEYEIGEGVSSQRAKESAQTSELGPSIQNEQNASDN